MSLLPDQVTLSADQQEAIDRVTAWWQDEPDRQTFSLAGYAGTGKTTIIYYLLEHFSSRVVVAAPTGKAALRLRQKGVDASTIHLLAYRYEGVDEDGELQFDFAGIRGRPTLVVIDEASMVNQRIYDDLLGAGYRMLFVGDHGQLPPVGGDPGIMRKPDFALSVIHRQDDEGLLDFAHALREGDFLPDAGGAVEKVWLDPRREFAVLGEVFEASDCVICWRNKTRHWMNRLALKQFGLITDSNVDARGILERLHGATARAVCLRNNYRHGVFNGQVVDLEFGDLGSGVVEATMITDSGRRREVLADPRGFFLEERNYQPPPNLALFDFGYALTAHKAQGSEWPHVAVYDEVPTRFEDWARWKYTAATRAATRLTWLHR